MTDAGTPLWEQCKAQPRPAAGTELDERISAALASRAVSEYRSLLERVGARIDPAPWLCRYLEERHLRLYFPVVGVSDEIREGSLTALMVMFDTDSKCTTHVQPVFAGPDVGAVVKDLAGRLAAPKPQPGPIGELAARRFREHKRALWHRFEQDCTGVGRAEASRRWKRDFRWALIRLHLCGKCEGCRFGSPFFDDAPSVPDMGAPDTRTPPAPMKFEVQMLADAITGSEAWRAQTEHAHRGGLELSRKPRLVHPIDQRYSIVVFPTNVRFIRAGLIVGELVYFDTSMSRVRHMHHLLSGEEAEWSLLFGDRELGLPPIAPEDVLVGARRRYVASRRDDWMRFWLEELEFGLDIASRHWRRAYWESLAAFMQCGHLLTAAAWAE